MFTTEAQRTQSKRKIGKLIPRFLPFMFGQLSSFTAFANCDDFGGGWQIEVVGDQSRIAGRKKIAHRFSGG
jgi:hypothetical protein